MARASIAKPQDVHRMMDVSELRHVFKIFCSIVVLHAILMINTLFWRARSYERLCHNGVDKLSATLPFVMWVYLFVSTIVIRLLKDKTRASAGGSEDAAYATKARDFVNAFKSNNCTPLFHGEASL